MERSLKETEGSNGFCLSSNLEWLITGQLVFYLGFSHSPDEIGNTSIKKHCAVKYSIWINGLKFSSHPH